MVWSLYQPAQLKTLWYNFTSFPILTMGLDNFDFMCYPKISFRYRKHSHLPHAHILVLVRMGPTNQETLLWLKSLTGPKYSSSTLEQAKTFFGSFDGDRKKLYGIRNTCPQEGYACSSALEKTSLNELWWINLINFPIESESGLNEINIVTLLSKIKVCAEHCYTIKRGPKNPKKGTQRGPNFEQKGDQKGTQIT